MLRLSKRSMLRGGIYHVALILVTAAAFNWGFNQLTQINIIARIYPAIDKYNTILAGALCASAVVVLWNNWVD